MSERGRQNEMVIVSVDGRYWDGYGWRVEYPDALTWGGDEYECYLVEDEDAYEEYLEDEFKAAKLELMNPAIPDGSTIVRGEGFANGGKIFTKGVGE